MHPYFSDWLLAEIAAELLDDTGAQLDLLETDLRDVPERHQQIHTVFEHSWHRLSEDERTVFMALSVFRGGCTREAAQTVANASLRILTSLVNKSFLNRTAAGRYSIHELLRQFGELELEGSSDKTNTRDAHATYYAKYLSEKGTELKGPRQIDALDEIEREIGNIQQAWLWVIDQKQLTSMAQMIEGLGMFYEWKGRYSEGETAFRTGAERLFGGQSNEEMRNYMQLLTWQSVFVATLGQLDFAQSLLARSRCLIEQESSNQEMLAEKAFNLWQQAKLIQQQDHEEAKDLFEESLVLFQVFGDQWSQAHLLNDLGGMVSMLEPHKKTLFQHLMRESLVLHQTVGNRFGILETLSRLGFKSAMRGDFKQCEEWFSQATIICKQIGDDMNARRQWLSIRGVACWFIGRYEEALSVHQEQLAIAENLGERGSVMVTSINLGMSLIFLGHYDQGVQLLQTTMVDCQQHGGQALLSYILLQLGCGYVAQGNYQSAYDTLHVCIDYHRASKANVRLYTALNNFGIAAWHAGNVAEAKAAQDEVLTYLAQDDNYIIQVGLMPLVALLQLRLNQKNNYTRTREWRGGIRTNHFSKPGKRWKRCSKRSISF
ncbi:hypothetical protein KFU94_56800 [Chloroflexi bacterium TSY]|nr:hypothetical protein [Chloroflexi bacterium TSY]